MIYRICTDVEAASREEAVNKFNDHVQLELQDSPSVINLFEVEERPFEEEDELILLEAARVALSDAETFDMLANNLDLKDGELKRIQGRLVELLGNRE